MSNRIDNAKRVLKERRAGFDTGTLSQREGFNRPGSLNPRKGGSPADRKLRVRTNRQSASRRAVEAASQR